MSSLFFGNERSSFLPESKIKNFFMNCERWLFLISGLIGFAGGVLVGILQNIKTVRRIRDRYQAAAKEFVKGPAK
jgi:hypothetical protein